MEREYLPICAWHWFWRRGHHGDARHCSNTPVFRGRTACHPRCCRAFGAWKAPNISPSTEQMPRQSGRPQASQSAYHPRSLEALQGKRDCLALAAAKENLQFIQCLAGSTKSELLEPVAMHRFCDPICRLFCEIELRQAKTQGPELRLGDCLIPLKNLKTYWSSASTLWQASMAKSSFMPSISACDMASLRRLRLSAALLQL